MGFIASTVHAYRYINNDISDPRTVDYPLVNNPLVVFIICTLYLILANYGPKLLEHRKPFKLDRIVLVYNVIQIIVNTYLFIAVLRACYIPLRYSLICEEVSTATTPEEMHLLDLAHLYFMIKILDLLDTVFIVLRKKSSQLSFLHIYHHCAMVIGGWAGIKYVPGGQSILLGTINCFVHSVMYSYYLLTVLDPKFRTSWLKKHITQLQIVQFFIIAVHLSLAAVTPGCNYPTVPILMALPCVGLIILLFGRYYKNEYSKKHEKNK